MKNKKGFTLIEMLVSFVLSMVLIIILFQLIIVLKEIYVSSGIKTELLNKQYLMTNKIYSDLNNRKIRKIESCVGSTVCVDFTFSDGTVKRFTADMDSKTIQYDTYKVQFASDSYIEVIIIHTTPTTLGKSMYNLKVGVKNELNKNTDFGLNILYPYNTIDVINACPNRHITLGNRQIEYIPYVQTNGNQFINLGYKAKPNTEIRLDIQLIENANTDQESEEGRVNIIGRASETDTYQFTTNFGAGPEENISLYYWVDKREADGGTVIGDTYLTITNRSTLIMKPEHIEFQGQVIDAESIPPINGSNDNMVLLGSMSRGHEVNEILAFDRYDTKIYGFQIYEGTNLIMDLAPATSDGVAGLYDKVNNQFLPSNGQSAFIYNES